MTRASRAIIFSGRDEQRVDVDFFNPLLLDDDFAKAHHELGELFNVDRVAAAHALEGGINFGAFHHAAREGSVERGQAEGAVLKDFDELAAETKEDDGTELGVGVLPMMSS